MTALHPAAVVSCSRPEPGSPAAAALRELAAHVEVRACGPGWPARDLPQVDASGVRFLLELDAAPGCVARPEGLRAWAARHGALHVAWLVDTHKKPALHRQVAAEVDLVLFAQRAWGPALGREATWLPLHADGDVFRPIDCTPDLDAVFVGYETWRAAPLVEVARRRGLRVEVATPAGPLAKAEAAALYARARVVFHRHATRDLDARVFEALAAGRVLLTDARENGQGELFEPDRHLVLYRDEAELEAQLMRLLGDAALRDRLERAAAELAHARHTTRVRVGELVRAIEARVGPLAAGAPPDTVAADVVEVRDPAAPPPSEPRAARGRWLVLAGPEPVAVQLLSYAERLAGALASRGDEVVVVRQRRTRAPLAHQRRAGVPLVFEVETGPLPEATTDENDVLASASPFQRAADGIAREHGPFAGVLAEGLLGAVVGPPLAERLGLPLVLALTDCEVARRSDVLTRHQLYQCELEHWALDRSALVLLPTPEAEAAVRRHYAAQATAVTGWPTSAALRPAPADAARLRQRLGLDPDALLVRAPLLAPDGVRELARDLARRGEPAVVLGERSAAFVARGAAPRLRGQPVVGPALGALAGGATVVLVGREDLAGADLASLAARRGRAAEPAAEALLAAARAAEPAHRPAPAVLAALDGLAARGAPAASSAHSPQVLVGGPA